MFGILFLVCDMLRTVCCVFGVWYVILRGVCYIRCVDCCARCVVLPVVHVVSCVVCGMLCVMFVVLCDVCGVMYVIRGSLFVVFGVLCVT